MDVFLRHKKTLAVFLRRARHTRNHRTVILGDSNWTQNSYPEQHGLSIHVVDSPNLRREILVPKMGNWECWHLGGNGDLSRTRAAPRAEQCSNKGPFGSSSFKTGAAAPPESSCFATPISPKFRCDFAPPVLKPEPPNR